MKLSCIIVNYHQGPEVAQCLESLDAAADGLHYEVLVVDNSCGDTSLLPLREKFPHVRFIINPTNIGFARANNQGVGQAIGEFILILNPDTVLESRSLRKMVDFFEAEEQVGIVAPKVLNPDGSIQYSCRRFPNLWTGLFNRYSLLSRWFPNNPFIGRYLMTDYDRKTARAVDWVSGCCMMIPRKLFVRIGGFDEFYFLFNEDVDLCRTVGRAGYRVMFFPDAQVTHSISSSNAKLPSRLIVQRHRGMSHYYRKHMSGNPFNNGMVDLFIGLRCASQLFFNLFKA